MQSEAFGFQVHPSQPNLITLYSNNKTHLVNTDTMTVSLVSSMQQMAITQPPVQEFHTPAPVEREACGPSPAPPPPG